MEQPPKPLERPTDALTKEEGERLNELTTLGDDRSETQEARYQELIIKTGKAEIAAEEKRQGKNPRLRELEGKLADGLTPQEVEEYHELKARASEGITLTPEEIERKRERVRELNRKQCSDPSWDPKTDWQELKELEKELKKYPL